jgi:hypothetical protein
MNVYRYLFLQMVHNVFLAGNHRGKKDFPFCSLAKYGCLYLVVSHSPQCGCQVRKQFLQGGDNRVKEAYDKLLKQVVGLAADVEKAAEGNQSAGVRLRQELLLVRGVVQDLRTAVLEHYKKPPTTKEEKTDEQ